MGRKKTEADRQKEADAVQAVLDREQERLDETILVCSIRDDSVLSKTTERSIMRGTPDYWYKVAAIRPIHPDFEKLRVYPMLQCTGILKNGNHCKFKNIYQTSIDHHMRYTHLHERRNNTDNQ